LFVAKNRKVTSLKFFNNWMYSIRAVSVAQLFTVVIYTRKKQFVAPLL
jgi:hypothetical protein